uniref:Uncharacterized protein n=1 Tax=Opuntia streptacantha TaxID=393608 RepID=A0A7C8ZRH1_OPUST
MKKPPDPEPVLPQPTLQSSQRPLSPSSEALSGVRGTIWKRNGDSVQIMMELSGGYMRMPTVSCQIDGETIATSTTMVESRWFGVITGREDAIQRISPPKDALSSAEGRLIVIGKRIGLGLIAVPVCRSSIIDTRFYGLELQLQL